MNYPTFLRQLRSEDRFKLSDKLKTFNIHPLPTRKIIVKQYECRKTIKSIQAKQKLQGFTLSTISDQSSVFFELKETNSSRPSVFTMAERQFMENNFFGALMGEMNEVSQEEYQITGFQWDGFMIQFLSFSEETFLFIITNEMIQSRVKSSEGKDIQIKIKQGFEEILTRIINQKKATELIDQYLQELKKLFDKHPELIYKTSDGQKVINFNLIKYQRIVEISNQQLKAKVDEEKKQRFLTQMQIQK